VSRSRRLFVGVALLVAALVAARAYAPIAIQRYVNRVLDRAKGYEGSIGDVDLSLLRGAYTVESVRIDKSDGKVPVPLFRAPQVDLSIRWEALLRGALVGEVWFEEPEVNLVVGPSPAQSQAGTENDWRDTVKALMPVRIDRVTVRRGTLHLRSFHADPPFDIYLRKVQGVADNLANSLDVAESLEARIRATAQTMEAGKLKLDVKLDPFEDPSDFDLELQMEGLALAHLNRFFRAYGGLDVQKGTLHLDAELVCKNGEFQGYLKPFFEGVDVVSREEVTEQAPWDTLWEGLAGAAAEVFEDQKRDRVATKIPISGRVESPRVGLLRTLANAVRNAYFEAFVPGLEHSVGEKRGG
jgi:uncharacterized protein involved in outer membrane biogenesis